MHWSALWENVSVDQGKWPLWAGRVNVICRMCAGGFKDKTSPRLWCLVRVGGAPLMFTPSAGKLVKAGGQIDCGTVRCYQSIRQLMLFGSHVSTQAFYLSSGVCVHEGVCVGLHYAVTHPRTILNCQTNCHEVTTTNLLCSWYLFYWNHRNRLFISDLILIFFSWRRSHCSLDIALPV